MLLDEICDYSLDKENGSLQLFSTLRMDLDLDLDLAGSGKDLIIENWIKRITIPEANSELTNIELYIAFSKSHTKFLGGFLLSLDEYKEKFNYGFPCNLFNLIDAELKNKKNSAFNSLTLIEKEEALLTLLKRDDNKKEIADTINDPKVVIDNEDIEKQDNDELISSEHENEISNQAIDEQLEDVNLPKNEPQNRQPEPVLLAEKEDSEKQTEQKTKILKVLDDFKIKIDGIGEHNSEAKKVAVTLHKNLINLVNESLGDKQYFVTQTKALIGKDIPTLQRDLAWGDFLKNLAKEICNTVTKAFSLGCHGGFFDTKKSDAVKEAEKLQDEVLSTQSFLEIK